MLGVREVILMGGPWRERGFDPRSLRRPAPREMAPARPQPGGGPGHGEGLTRVVVTYIAAVAMSIGLMLAFMQHGW